MTGTHEFNEVFFDVRIPRENLIGDENRGWYCPDHALLRALEHRLGRGRPPDRGGLREVCPREQGQGHHDLDHDPSVKYFVDRFLEAEVGRMMSYKIVSIQAKEGVRPAMRLRQPSSSARK